MCGRLLSLWHALYGYRVESPVEIKENWGG